MRRLRLVFLLLGWALSLERRTIPVSSLRGGAEVARESPGISRRGGGGGKAPDADAKRSKDAEASSDSVSTQIPKKKKKKKKRKYRILILMSDTGGGHRASAKALVEALSKQYPGEFETEIYDIWTDAARWPLNHFVSCYSYLGRRPMLWRGLWYATAAWPMRAPIRTWHDSTNRGRFTRALETRDPDLVVSVHPLCQHVPLSALAAISGKNTTSRWWWRTKLVPKVPFATVVTDLGSAHPMWFDSRADVVFVPNARVARLARFHGVKRGAIIEHGLPLREAFEYDPSEPGSGDLFSPGGSVFGALTRLVGTAPSARQRRQERLDDLMTQPPRILVVGGGDGVGGMKRIVLAAAAALRERQKPATLVVVCGKNTALKSQLETALYQVNDVINVQILGFVNDMHRKMADADVLLTKAGPGTISEAAALGLPVILTNFLPGQERGNCAFVTENGFGALAKRPGRAARLLVDWLDHPAKLRAMSDHAFDAAKPGSTSLIARDIANLAKGRLPTNKKR